MAEAGIATELQETRRGWRCAGGRRMAWRWAASERADPDGQAPSSLGRGPLGELVDVLDDVREHVGDAARGAVERSELRGPGAGVVAV